jgi:hypothetical protein
LWDPISTNKTKPKNPKKPGGVAQAVRVPA